MHRLRAFALSVAVTATLAAQARAAEARATEAAGDQGAQIVLALDAGGALSATGTLPRGLAPEDLRAALPGIDLAGLERADNGPDWQAGPALDALSIVLPRFRSADIRLGENRLAVEGALKSGLSAAGVQAALRSALGAGWRLDLNITETAPIAEIVLSQSGEGVVVSGLLPAGLDPAEALRLVDPEAIGLGLAGGGDGNAAEWSDAVAALGTWFDLFASATARMAPDEIAVDGVLRPGYARAAVAERIQAELPAGWRVALDAEEMQPSEGDRRISLETGAPESFRRGYWLPEVAFTVSAPRCAAEADAALDNEGVPFVEGEAEIRQGGEPLLNRLAAIAVRCLNSSSLRLEIGGHTDSVGNDATNQELSDARADAVRQALVDRGVREESVTARGYGESLPIATNNTPEGRAQNSRIAFEWIGPQD